MVPLCRLVYADAVQPFLHVEARARFGGYFVVAYYPYLWMAAVEVLDIALQRGFLRRRARVFRGLAVLGAAPASTMWRLTEL